MHQTGSVVCQVCALTSWLGVSSTVCHGGWQQSCAIEGAAAVQCTPLGII